MIGNNFLVIKNKKEKENSNPDSKEINQNIPISNHISNNENPKNIVKAQNEININSINNNGISLNSNQIKTEINFNKNQGNNNHKWYIKHLIRTAYFKKEFLSPNNSLQNNLIQAYLINKKIISKLIRIFGLEDAIDNLVDDKLNGISYRNFNDNYYRISEYLSEIGFEYLNEIGFNQFKGEIKFAEDEKLLTKKYLTYPKDLNYIDDFEIIDKNFMLFLKGKFEKLVIASVKFGKIKNNNIFFVIKHDQKYHYQIMRINMDNNLKFEYLIEVVENKAFNYENASHNYIFGVFEKSDLKSLTAKGNPIKLANNEITLNLFSNDSLYKNRNKNNSRPKNYVEFPSIMTNTIQTGEISLISYCFEN